MRENHQRLLTHFFQFYSQPLAQLLLPFNDPIQVKVDSISAATGKEERAYLPSLDRK